MTTTLTTEQREIDLVRRFADGTPLSPKDFTFGQANHLLFVNGGGGWALTEYGRSLLNGTVAALPPGDTASCPDEDSYWPPSRKLPKAWQEDNWADVSSHLLFWTGVGAVALSCVIALAKVMP